MTNEEARIVAIERFVNGEMNTVELTEFEQQLKVDPELVKEVELFKDMVQGAIYFGENVVSQEVSDVHNDLKENGFFNKYSSSGNAPADAKIKSINTKTKRFKIPRIAIAAVGLFLIGVALFLFKPDNVLEKRHAAFSKNFKPENTKIHDLLDELTAKGMATTDRPKKDSLTAALNFYLESNYDNAKTHLTQYLKHHSSDSFAQLYLGLTNLHLGEYKQAQQYLEQVYQLNDFEFRDVTKWYLAQNYIMLNNQESMDKAMKLFEELAKDPNSEFQVEAGTYIDQLD